MNPIIETERLALRNWLRSDAMAFDRHCNTASVMHWLGGVQSNDQLMEDVEWFIENQERDGFTFWVMERKEDHEFLGFCGLIRVSDEDSPICGQLEVGWRLREDQWRNGYAHEAAAKVLKYAFKQLKADEVFSRVSPGNQPSRKLMEKLGLRRRRILTHVPSGEADPLYVYSIIREE